MTVAVNLLPAAYRQHRRRARNFKSGVTVGAVLLAAELGVGLVLHARAEETRQHLASADSARASARNVQKQLADPTKQAELLESQVVLARRLRTTHHWSRLLAALAAAAPERVVLTSIATEPPQWQKTGRSASSGGAAGKHDGQEPALVEGVVVQGFAAEHNDLALFVTALNETEAFANVEMKDARRDLYQEKEAIAFTLNCGW